ncbi:MAG: hypothetical protein WB609_02260 [Candidatus Cybelea sp.]
MAEANKGNPPEKAASGGGQDQTRQRNAEDSAKTSQNDSGKGQSPDTGKTETGSELSDWQKFLKRPELVATAITALATVGILIANSLYAVFAAWQLTAINDQSRAIKTQASAAIVAANAAASAADTARQALTKEQSNFATSSATSAAQFSTQLQKINIGLAEQNRLATASEKGVVVSRKALVVGESQFIKAQRPYIWVGIKYGPDYSGNRVRLDVELINYGKSPAINVLWWHYIRVFTDGGVPVNNRIHVALLTLPKNSPSEDSFVEPTGTATAWRTDQSIVLTDAQMQYIKSSIYGWVEAGVVTYSDSSGKRYRTQYCWPYYPASAQQECGDHTQLK